MNIEKLIEKFKTFTFVESFSYEGKTAKEVLKEWLLCETLQGASKEDLEDAKKGLEDALKDTNTVEVPMIKKKIGELDDILASVKESKINEISDELASDVNAKRQLDVVKKNLEYTKTGSEEDKELAKEAEEKADKNNKLYKKWKKARKGLPNEIR